MPNSTTILAFDEVKTPVDQIHYLNQECVTTGVSTTFCTYIVGLVGIPLLLRGVHHRIPMQMEYKMFTGAAVSAVFAYYAGVYAKKRCEENLKRQFAEKLMS